MTTWISKPSRISLKFYTDIEWSPNIGLPNFDSRVSSWIVSIGSCLFGVVSVSRADFSSRCNTTISSSRLLSCYISVSRSIVRTTNGAELTNTIKVNWVVGESSMDFPAKIIKLSSLIGRLCRQPPHRNQEMFQLLESLLLTIPSLIHNISMLKARRSLSWYPIIKTKTRIKFTSIFDALK